MNYRNLYIATLIFLGCAIGFIYTVEETKIESKKCEICIPSDKINRNAPPCLQMYDAIIKYSEQYAIPKKYAFGIAYAETRYGGPFDWKYNHAQTSCVGAVGPMQIMPATGRSLWDESEYSNKKLMNDIDFNVHSSMKLLRKLYDKYRDWKLVFGCYNTGRPMINDYAIRVFNHKPQWSIK